MARGVHEDKEAQSMANKRKSKTRPTDTPAPVLKPNGVKPLNDVVSVRQTYRTTQDIESWRTAIRQAENIYMPRRVLLYRLYKDLVLDGQLGTVMDKRIMAITNSKIMFREHGSKENSTDPDIVDMLSSGWFIELLRYYMEKYFYGHSLIEFAIANGKITGCELVRRDNVIPETGIVSWDGIQADGIPFRDPPYSNYTIEAGKPTDLGLFMSVAQYVIYKRGAFGDWSQFAEIFGMPFREAQYDPYDQSSRQKLEKALEEAGSAQYMVTPKGTELKIHETSRNGKNDIYKDLIGNCDEQISKRILGNTMTTDQGSSRSQGEVHQDEQAAITLSDKRELLAWLNGKFKQILAWLGMAVQYGGFIIEEEVHIPLKDRILIDTALNNIIPIDPAYFYDTYNVPPPKSGIPEETKVPASPAPSGQPGEDPNEDEDPEDDPDDADEPASTAKAETRNALSLLTQFFHLLGLKKKPILNPIYSNRAHQLAALSVHHSHVSLAYKGAAEGLSDDIVASVKAGQKLSPEQYQWMADQLIGGLHMGWGKPDYTSKDEVSLNMMEANIFKFTASKSLATNIELNQLARESGTFSAFKAKADLLLHDYNTAYMEAEYNHAQAVGQSASAYIQALKDGMNYGRYQTVGDSRVRPEHAALNGMVFKLDDGSALQYLCPNGYRCRCEDIYFMDHHSGEVSTGTDFAERIGADAVQQMKKTGFLTNWADTGECFSRNQMYLTNNFEAGLSLADMYGTDKMAWDKLDKSDFPEAAKTSTEGLGDSVVKDYRGRDIKTGSVKDHLNAAETLAKPDEVWMASKGDGYTYTYIKMYQGNMSVVQTSFSKGRPSTVKKVATASSDKYRKGILVKRLK
jgi:SPP1 gp7 family putative phage head morphogenesis protein